MAEGSARDLAHPLPASAKLLQIGRFSSDGTTRGWGFMPLSQDPEARRRQLANLQRGGGLPATPGNALALKHGGQSALLLRDVEAEVRELFDALADSAPVRDPDGSLPAADVVAVERAARALKRWRHLAQWCDLHGRLVEKTGEVKPAAELELRAERELGAALDAIGCTPMARSKLGLRLAQALDLAQAAAEDWRAEQEEAD
jgi:hypothetical protein